MIVQADIPGVEFALLAEYIGIYFLVAKSD
jgi:hypothetical protein